MKRLPLISGILVAGLALAAFVLSFEAISALAVENGVNPSLAWLMPILVDGAMIVFSINVLRATVAGESTRIGWGLILAFTAVSVVFNIEHGQKTLWGVAMSALAPIALFTSFETLMTQIRAAAQHGLNIVKARLESEIEKLKEAYKNLKATYNELKAAHEELKADYEALQDRANRLQERADEVKVVKAENTRLKNKLKELESIEAIPASLGPAGRDLLKVIDGRMTAAEMARQHEFSESWLSRYIPMLNGGQKN